ncbi:MAG: hypothetical protein ACRESK_11010, partial [Gammaproteobacteria bacterium]
AEPPEQTPPPQTEKPAVVSSTVVATPAPEPKIAAAQEATETVPPPRPTTATAEAATTDKSGGLRGFFNKFLSRKKDDSAAEQTATADINTTADPSVPAAPAPVSSPPVQETEPAPEPEQLQSAAPVEKTQAKQSPPDTVEEPMVLAKAESKPEETPLPETAEKKLQGISLETMIAQAVEGDVEAQFQLGKSYYLGTQVKQDYGQAFLWFRRAALQGHAEAQYNLGNMYLMGEGIEQSDLEAGSWYEQAAEQGHETARQNLEKLQQMARQEEMSAETAEVEVAAEETPEEKGGVFGYLGKFFGSDDEDAGMEAEYDSGESYDDAMAQAETDTSVPAPEAPAVHQAPGQNDYERGLAYSEGDGVP